MDHYQLPCYTTHRRADQGRAKIQRSWRGSGAAGSMVIRKLSGGHSPEKIRALYIAPAIRTWATRVAEPFSKKHGF